MFKVDLDAEGEWVEVDDEQIRFHYLDTDGAHQLSERLTYEEFDRVAKLVAEARKYYNSDSGWTMSVEFN